MSNNVLRFYRQRAQSSPCEADRGLKVIDTAVTNQVTNLARLTSGLTESEAKRLDRLLDRYLAALESVEDPDCSPQTDPTP